MGLFCVSTHARTTDDRSVSESLQRLGFSAYHVSSEMDGWTSIYEERASQQDDQQIRRLAGEISRDLKVPTIAFLVHDSDFVCYWLYDSGALLDEYNSCPDYFDDEGAEPIGSQGSPGTLLPFCRAEITPEQIEAILGRQTIFAEETVQQLALALGIDPGRALCDYSDVADNADGLPGADASPDTTPLQPNLLSGLGDFTGLGDFMGGDDSSVDPQVKQLVSASANGDLEEVDRLLTTDVTLDAAARAELPGTERLSGLGQLVPGGMPTVAMFPLLAAVLHGHRPVIERLLDRGADPNHVHPLFGTSMHAATGAGDVEILRLLLDRGGNPRAIDAHGRTPLEVLKSSRETIKQLAQAEQMLKSMGTDVPDLVKKALQSSMPTRDWDACEELLRDSGG